ncbi:MAG: hypothetical protein KIS87_12520 [Phycisphaeraceae bacterium]|nr:hypothetical protein [Phycisphaeraceae bacterium]
MPDGMQPGEIAPREPDAARPDPRGAWAERVEVLRRDAPQPADTEARIWAVLTPEQQAHVRARLDAIRREIDSRRDEAFRQMMTERLRAERESNRQAPAIRRPAADPWQRGDIPPELLQRLPERAVERLRAMDPEQRRRAINRLMERRFEQQLPARSSPGERRSPPPIERVDVPEPL